MQQVFGALRPLGSSLGFEEAVLGRFRADPQTGEMIAGEFEATHREGVLRYVAMIEHDPFVSEYEAGNRPVLFRYADWEPKARTLAQRQVVEDPHYRSSAFRIVMPQIVTPDGGGWSVIFGGQDNIRQDREAELAAPILWLAASAVGRRMVELEAAAPPDVRLTRREAECLLRLARGERVDRIAERMGLSNTTIEFHLANARRRLGARTSVEAVVQAILARLIVP